MTKEEREAKRKQEANRSDLGGGWGYTFKKSPEEIERERQDEEMYRLLREKTDLDRQTKIKKLRQENERLRNESKAGSVSEIKSFSQQEREIVTYLCEGLIRKEIEKRLSLSDSRTKDILYGLSEKLGMARTSSISELTKRIRELHMCD